MCRRHPDLTRRVFLWPPLLNATCQSMLAIGRTITVAAAGLSLLSVASCAPPDPDPPWKPEEMRAQLTPELRRFEGAPSEHVETVILAWQIETEVETPSRPGIPAPDGSGLVLPQERRVESALLWRRRGPERAPIDWALVQVHRFPRSEPAWQLSLMSRELTAPLTRLRPGELADGTWRAYQRYDRPPTSQDACDFAAVGFLADQRPWRRIAGAFRPQVWTRALGAVPACSFPEAVADSRR